MVSNRRFPNRRFPILLLPAICQPIGPTQDRFRFTESGWTRLLNDMVPSLREQCRSNCLWNSPQGDFSLDRQIASAKVEYNGSSQKRGPTWGPAVHSTKFTAEVAYRSKHPKNHHKVAYYSANIKGDIKQLNSLWDGESKDLMAWRRIPSSAYRPGSRASRLSMPE